MTPRWEHQPDAVLDAKDVGDWLKISPKQALRLKLAWFAVGKRERRVLAKDVLVFIERAKEPRARLWKALRNLVSHWRAA